MKNQGDKKTSELRSRLRVLYNTLITNVFDSKPKLEAWD